MIPFQRQNVSAAEKVFRQSGRDSARNFALLNAEELISGRLKAAEIRSIMTGL